MIDVEEIGKDVSIAMFVPKDDELCPFLPLLEVKTDFMKWYETGGHALFTVIDDPEFVDELIE